MDTNVTGYINNKHMQTIDLPKTNLDPSFYMRRKKERV